MVEEMIKVDNECSLYIFIDLQEAFGTTDHSLSLRKLEKYGMITATYSWLKSYLENR